jgi:GNAT superfamily N-acetyltransferase
MNVEVVKQIPERHRHRVAELLVQCFRVAEWPATRRREHDDRFCSQANVWRHVLAVHNDGVVGLATVYTRRLERSGATMVLGGLGDVCTDRAWRHQGIATAVVTAAMQEMARARCDMAYLCAAVNDPGMVRLYGQVGFVPLRRPHTFFGKSGRLYEDHDAMIAPVGDSPVFRHVVNSAEPFHIGIGNW